MRACRKICTDYDIDKTRAISVGLGTYSSCNLALFSGGTEHEDTVNVLRVNLMLDGILA